MPEEREAERRKPDSVGLRVRAGGPRVHGADGSVRPRQGLAADSSASPSFGREYDEAHDSEVPVESARGTRPDGRERRERSAGALSRGCYGQGSGRRTDGALAHENSGSARRQRPTSENRVQMQGRRENNREFICIPAEVC